MSLTLNMVGGGSGGGISGNEALLQVTTTTGASVSITDGVTTKTQSASDGHADTSRPTTAIYLFGIKTSEFGTWTVSVAKDGNTNSKTISISSAEKYEINVGTTVPLDVYQPVEYLRATKTQHINLGFKATGTSEFYIDFLIENPIQTASGHGWVFGTRNNVADSNFGLTTFLLTGFPNGDFVYGSGSDVFACSHDAGIVVGQRMQASFRNYHYITSTGKDETIAAKTFTQNYNVELFNIRLSASSVDSAGMQGNIYSAKFWSNSNTLIRELYPCYRLSDSVAGMYDKANDVFYPNAGSGTFIVGADV